MHGAKNWKRRKWRRRRKGGKGGRGRGGEGRGRRREEDEEDEEDEEEDKEDEEDEAKRREEGRGRGGGESVENLVRGDSFKAKAEAKPKQSKIHKTRRQAGGLNQWIYHHKPLDLWHLLLLLVLMQQLTVRQANWGASVMSSGTWRQ